MKVEFISPDDTEQTARELYFMGIPELQFNVLEKDKYQIIRGYLGMAVKYADKQEVIPVIENTRNLEYQVTLAIKKLTSETMPIIGYAVSSDNESQAKTALNKLRELYALRKIDLKNQEQVSSDIATLILIGENDFEEQDLEKIDNFLMQDRSLLVLTDGINVEEGLAAIQNKSSIHGLLEQYGIKVNNDLVLDVSSGLTSFSQGFISFALNYPFWPKVIKGGFDSENSAVARLESVVFPWASSLEIIKKEENSQISYLANTTKNAWTQVENFDLNPQQKFYPKKATQEYNLAVSILGKIKSAYKDKSTESGRLIVVGDSDFIKDRYLRQAGDNIAFFQNLVDVLSIDEDLINIRSKGITERPIRDLQDNLRNTIRYVNVFGITIIVIAFGLFRHYARRRKKEF